MRRNRDALAAVTINGRTWSDPPPCQGGVGGGSPGAKLSPFVREVAAAEDGPRTEQALCRPRGPVQQTGPTSPFGGLQTEYPLRLPLLKGESRARLPRYNGDVPDFRGRECHDAVSVFRAGRPIGEPARQLSPVAVHPPVRGRR